MITLLRRKLNSLTSDKKLSEILTGSVWTLASRVFATGLGLISSIIIARAYGAEVIGIVAVINSFLMLATIFTVMGTDTSILRLIPEHLAKYSSTSAFKLYRKTQGIVIGVSLITGGLFFFASNFIADKVFSKPHLSFYFALASAFIVFRSLKLLNTQAIRGLRLIKFFAFMQILPQCFNLIFLVLLGFLLNSGDVPVYAHLSGFALTGIIGWIIIEYVFKKAMKPHDVEQPIAIKEILSLSLPMLMTSTMNFTIGQTGVIMLGMFRSEREVGLYAIAVKLATLTTFVLSAINSMAAPKFSELYHSGKINDLFYVAQKSTKIIFWTTMPILLGLVIFGKLTLQIIFGQDFVLAYPALLFLVLGQSINSISGSTGVFMNMTGNQKILRNIMTFAATGNIGLNLLLIPPLGIYGSAIAAMITITFWNISTLIYIKINYNNTTSYFPFFFKKNKHTNN